MSIEHEIVARAGSTIVSNGIRALAEREFAKGCCRTLSDTPVSLEPRYTPLTDLRGLLNNVEEPVFTPEEPPDPRDLVRLALWVTPDQGTDWVRAEAFLKHLQRTRSRVVFEIIGNRERICFRFLCHKDDQALLSIALRGQYPHCRLSTEPESQIDWYDSSPRLQGSFRDCLPTGPYSHLLTRPDEFRVSPFTSLLETLYEIVPPAFGVFQVVFRCVSSSHNWHRNIDLLFDLEFAQAQVGGFQPHQRIQQQTPSGEIHVLAYDTEAKAHNDKPLFVVALRLGVFGVTPEIAEAILHAMGGLLGTFQHGGRPLSWLTGQDYSAQGRAHLVRDLFQWGITLRPGFLVNTRELVGLVHASSLNSLESRHLPIATLDPIPEPAANLSEGLLIGYQSRAGVISPVCIPAEKRFGQAELIGAPGEGKSRLMEKMALEDIEGKQSGVVIIDPHGDLAERVAALIPDHALHRLIYFDPGDPDWIPLWNPLKVWQGRDISRIADDFLHAFKNIVTGWGDRLEHLFRQGLLGVLRLPSPTLLLVALALSNSNPMANQLWQEILMRVETKYARNFWHHDIKRYGVSDFAPVQHKLGKILSEGPVASMLSQPESRIDFRAIMDDGLIFIANLSHVGEEIRETLGSLILALIHAAALTRSDLPPEDRRPCHVYSDEFHRFLSGSIEGLLTETRKFRVSLTLAHQHNTQLSDLRVIDTLSLLPICIVFRTQHRDAEQLSKRFGGVVQARDLLNLTPREAIVRIGTDVVRVTTPETPGNIDRRRLKAIIHESQKRWCVRREQLEKIPSNRIKTSPRQGCSELTSRTYREEDFTYDTL